MRDTPLKRLRLARGKTLKAVADGVNSDPGNISRIERGKQCSPALAAKLVAFFGADAISELEILYPQRYPTKKKARNSRREKRADMAESARG